MVQMIRPRKPIERLQEYRPPREGRVGKIRLDFNENTVGCAPAVVRALRRTLQSEWLACYPEYEKGRATLARYFGVSKDEMLITNGVDDAIKLICDTFVDPGDSLVVPAPTFPIYQFFQDVAGGKTVHVCYNPGLRFPVERFVAAIRRGGRRTRWVALANPNNPTGTLISKPDLALILRSAPQSVVLVDEAYFDFSQATILPWIRRYKNLIVGRTFSKAFGLAGLRIGFLFGHRELMGLVRRAHAVFAVNAVGMAASVEATRHTREVDRYAAMVRTQRARLCRQLDALGIAWAPSAANFVLVRAGARAAEIARRLRTKHILVRDWSYDPHLRFYLRITVGTAAQMRRLTHELERLRRLIEPGAGADAWRDLMTYPPPEYFG
ncbi:MAG TPA: histidinol-phosphate transaminase [Terriglobia bacterium]|nr:histidinol-phosphate transaminase [Terriglobia bacterium]